MIKKRPSFFSAFALGLAFAAAFLGDTGAGLRWVRLASPRQALGGPPKKALHPKPVRVWQRGSQALAQGRYGDAVRWLKQAARELPHWGLIHLDLAQALQYDGHPREAIGASLLRALELVPQNPRAHFLAALYYEGSNEEEKALTHYQKSLTLGYAEPQACLRAVAIWHRRKQARQTLPCLMDLFRRRVHLGEVHHALAETYAQMGWDDEAASNWLNTLVYRGSSLWYQRQALQFFRRTLERQPKSKRARWLRSIRDIERKIQSLLPRKPERNLRPLLPSRR